MSDLHITMTGLDNLVRDMSHSDAIVGEELVTMVNRATLYGTGEAQKEAAVDTGAMRAGIHASPAVRAGGTVRGSYAPSHKYAYWVEKGRGPIVAGAGRMLRFTIGGAVFYRKRVGPARAQPFMAPSALRVQAMMGRLGRDAAARIADRLGSR